ncbi:MAG: glycogen phosphorylase, partial [Frankiaceae bacterium]|nr:glycogen phosphorylase [Frankiaceae bacterium]
MRALRRFTVRTQLPPELARLSDLVMNLRWSWHAPSMDLFERVDPKLWHAVGRDPLRLLGEVSSARLDALAADGDFNWRLGEVHADLQR